MADPFSLPPVDTSAAKRANPADMIGAVKTRAQAEKVAQDFEKMFISEMLKPMFDGIKTDGITGGGGGHRIGTGALGGGKSKREGRKTPLCHRTQLPSHDPVRPFSAGLALTKAWQCRIIDPPCRALLLLTPHRRFVRATSDIKQRHRARTTGQMAPSGQPFTTGDEP